MFNASKVSLKQRDALLKAESLAFRQIFNGCPHSREHIWHHCLVNCQAGCLNAEHSPQLAHERADVVLLPDKQVVFMVFL